MEKLSCKECGYENEPERVYCHNCGVKLDRSVLVEKKDPKKKPLPPRLRPASRGGAPLIVGVQRFLKTLIATACFSASAAAVVQMVRPPDSIPPDDIEVNSMAPLIEAEMEEALNAKLPKQLVYTDKQITGYFRNSLRAKKEGFLGDYVWFERMYAQFPEAETATVGCEYILYRWPLYFGLSGGVDVGRGQMTMYPKGGYIGRLPVHPNLVTVLGPVFSKVKQPLSRELELLKQMKSVQIEKGRMSLYASPAIAVPGR